MKVYLFTRKDGKVTHGVYSRNASLGHFELDRIFGGDLVIFCTGKPGEGAGVLSEVPMSTDHVTCKGCLAKMKAEGVGIRKIPKAETWHPKRTRPIDQPRVLGIPG